MKRPDRQGEWITRYCLTISFGYFLATFRLFTMNREIVTRRILIGCFLSLTALLPWPPLLVAFDDDDVVVVVDIVCFAGVVR